MSNYKQPNPIKRARRDAWRRAIAAFVAEKRGFNRGASEGWRARNNRKAPRLAVRSH